MPYGLIELTTADVVGVHATEDEARRDVAETIRLYGPGTVTTLAPGFDDDRTRPAARSPTARS
jgi:hypothetical protein